MRRAALAVLLFCSNAFAAEPREEALKHFQIGAELVGRSAWDSALAEFLRSRELYPTATALKNAAVCLRELGRYDEALDMYEETIARFGEMPDVRADMAKLERYVGALDVKSEPGSSIVVDGRVRGTTPLAKPIRVTVGSRMVRVTKDAFAPFETRVRIASGETTRVEASMLVVSKLGTLRVKAPAGYDVVVDGAVVGTTPFEGTLTAGDHAVGLRNASDEGTDASTVRVETGGTTEIAPPLGKLDGALRVEPTPSDAIVAIDGKDVGRGSWSGVLPSGQHEVVVRAAWHETVRQPVRISSRASQAVRPVLETVPRAFMEIAAGFIAFYDTTARLELGPCNDACFGTMIGLRGGYQITERISAELFVDTTSMPRSSRGELRTATRYGEVVTVNWGERADATTIIGGAAVRYQLFKQTPLVFRMAVGLARLFVSTGSVGDYFPFGRDASLKVGHVGIDQGYWMPSAMPEIRFGWRFSNGVVFDAGVGLLLFAVPGVAAATGSVPESTIDTWPRSASFGGGIGWALPLTGGIRFEL